MLIETGILYMVLSASAVKSNTVESEVVCVTVSDPAREVISASLETVIGLDLSSVQEIRHVLVENAEGNLLVWVAADNPTAEVRERIFNKQFGIIEAFPEVSFDFNLISAKDRPAGEISSSARVIYTREG